MQKMISLVLLAAALFSQVLDRSVTDTHIDVSKDEYKQRRQALMDSLPDHPIVLIGNVDRNRINDTQYQFRQESNFYYLSGHNEANAFMVLSKKPFEVDGKMVNEVIFVPENNKNAVTWTGKRLGTEGAKEKLGFEAAVPVSKEINGQNVQMFQEFMKELSLTDNTFHLVTPIIYSETFGQHGLGWRERPSYYKAYAQSLKDVLGDYIQSKKSKDDNKNIKLDDGGLVNIVDPREVVGVLRNMRAIKSDREIELIQRAVDVSGNGHFESFKIAKDVNYEYQVEAAIEFAFKYHGADGLGYQSIVGCGDNATILHYQTNRDKYKKNMLFCLDAGAEYNNYTADITRSFPASGKFSKEQREVYEIVLAAQKAGEKELVPGSNYQRVAEAINKVLMDGMIRLGIVKDKSEGGDARYSNEENRKQLREVYMHGWGHGVGLDVHDPAARDNYKEGLVFTIEPGIYISERSDLEIDPKYMGIGVRIEDMYVITKDGNRRMSANIPREVDEIEKIAKQKSKLVLN
ncbi:MAG: aminopeptidase P N-terminal domain-containing protein [Calditrichaeota bacterium]|nr:aminopeptidase P N-terminal domain-containing protein [Calditrichota bacterium]